MKSHRLPQGSSAHKPENPTQAFWERSVADTGFGEGRVSLEHRRQIRTAGWLRGSVDHEKAKAKYDGHEDGVLDCCLWPRSMSSFAEPAFILLDRYGDYGGANIFALSARRQGSLCLHNVQTRPVELIPTCSIERPTARRTHRFGIDGVPSTLLWIAWEIPFPSRSPGSHSHWRRSFRDFPLIIMADVARP